MEVEVCQPSDNEEDNLCSEVEVQLLEQAGYQDIWVDILSKISYLY